MSVLDKLAPAIDAVAVTTSDTLNLQDSNARQRISDSISLAVAGDLRVTLAGVSEQGGATVTIVGLTAGKHELRVSKIFATGTTATGITAYFS